MNKKLEECLEQEVRWKGNHKFSDYWRKKYTFDKYGADKSSMDVTSMKLTINKYICQGEAFIFLVDIIYDYSPSVYKFLRDYLDAADVIDSFNYTRETSEKDILDSLKPCDRIFIRFEAPELNDKQRYELVIKKNKDLIDKATEFLSLLEHYSKVYNKVYKYLYENHEDLLKKIDDMLLEKIENEERKFDGDGDVYYSGYNFDIKLGLRLIEESVKNNEE